jgi:multicomponent Na+:H+ antiporter subunit F
MRRMIPLAGGVAIAVAAVLVLARLFAGPTLYDRLLAALSLVGKAALICAALGALIGSSALVDAAITLAFASLVLSAASLKFFRTRTFQAPIGRSARG